jgi:hypothetical protein
VSTEEDPAAALRAEVARLEEIRERLESEGGDPESVQKLADAALAASERITALLPQVLDPDDSP